MRKVQRLSEAEAKAVLPELINLLQNTVDGGASVGFLPPLSTELAEAYWRESIEEVASGSRILMVAREADALYGSVQLALATKQNGLHRAEVQKLIVNTEWRGRGIARALMEAVEAEARGAGRTLLVLDTEQGSAAVGLYEKQGYTRAGVIPQFALNAEGSLINTVVFFKLLK
jgi:acetyltransferase